MIQYLYLNYERVLSELGQHLYIIILSLPISVFLGVFVGVLISRNKLAERIVIGIANMLMTIPSLALFGFAIILLAPLQLGIGIAPAVFALVIYSFLPVTRNTVVALQGVPANLIEAATGMGMTNRQIMIKIKFPLAVPLLMAGIRNACIMGVSVTTIAYLVGAEGLGYFIFAGLSRTNMGMILTGAIIVALLGIVISWALQKLEYVLTPKGLRLKEGE